MSEESLLQLSGLNVSYRVGKEHVSAVREVELEIASGESVAIVGESGSGKSTVAHAIIGLLPRNAEFSAEAFRFSGRSLLGISEREWRTVRGVEVGFVPQDPMVSLNPVTRIGEQIAEVFRIHGTLGAAEAARRAIELLELVGIPEPAVRSRQYPSQLSGGMRQRVLIAIALAGSPRLIVADEPTTALDVTVQRQILDYVEQLVRDAGTSLLLITHDLGVAADRADRIVVMSGGRVVEQGDARQVVFAPTHPYTRQLIAAAPSLNLDVPPRAPREHAPYVTISAVTKSFVLPRRRGNDRRFTAVDGVSLDVGRGETLGIVGESGSGKSTLARLIAGLEHPDSGEVRLGGKVITGLRGERQRRLRQDVQFVHQSPYDSLDPLMSVESVIGEPLRAFARGTRAERRERVVELLDQVALGSEYLDRRPAELSGGQRQRVAIARALALRPSLILLDEPVSALDVSVQAQILQLLTELQQELGISYLFISHDMAVIHQIADSVAVMRAGRVVEYGSAHEVFANPRDPYTRELLASVPGRRFRAAEEDIRIPG